MNVLVIFARPHVPGATKTRLAAAVGDASAAELAAAFLADTLATCDRAGTDRVEVWWAKEGRAGGHHLQPPGDLGVRMRAALDASTSHGNRACVIGSDSPTLPPQLLESSFRALDDADLVLGPAADGGYWLIGARAPLPATIFDGVPWSAPTTRRATMDRAMALGLRVAMLAPWYDIDAPADLGVLAAHLALDPAAAPATARVLASLNASAP